MKSLTHEQIFNLTIMPTSEGQLVGINRDNAQEKDLIPVGMVQKDYANLVGASANMYRILSATIEGNEKLLHIVENEGLDRVAAHLIQLIAAMKLVQKSAIEGPSVLTAIKPNAN